MPQCLLCLQLGKRDEDCENTHPYNLGHDLAATEVVQDEEEPALNTDFYTGE